MRLPHGLLLWHKKAGITSFSALWPIKKELSKAIKVGHAGTLDKAAHGLELVLVGAFTRLNPIFSHLDKEYIATITFGYETSTLDSEGDVIKEAPLPTLQRLKNAIREQRLGKIMQAPPIYSALHIDGKRAYQYAMAGQEVTMKLRPVLLHNLEIIAIKTTPENLVQELIISVSCGGGFYVRSFARDLAYSAGSVATLTDLERIGIGNYTNKWAFKLDDAIDEPKAIRQKLLSAKDALGSLQNTHLVYAKPEYYEAIKLGKPFQPSFLLETLPANQEEEPLFILNQEGELLAQVYHNTIRWVYQFVVHNPC